MDALAELRLGYEGILGLRVKSLECCLLGKLSVINTRPQTLLPARHQKVNRIPEMP